MIEYFREDPTVFSAVQYKNDRSNLLEVLDFLYPLAPAMTGDVLVVNLPDDEMIAIRPGWWVRRRLGAVSVVSRPRSWLKEEGPPEGHGGHDEGTGASNGD